ncbi:MAG: hypothetical protein ACI4KM_01140 [Oscillospiraceae bacterium]
MTLDEFVRKNHKPNPLLQERRIAETLQQVIDVRLEDAHCEPNDPFALMWKKACALFPDKTMGDVVMMMSDIPESDDIFESKLPYLNENAFFCMTLIANDYLCTETGQPDNSPHAILNRFFSLERKAYFSFVSKYVFKHLTADSIDKKLSGISGSTVGEMLISANKSWNHYSGANTAPKMAVMYLLGFPIAFCFLLKEGQIKMKQLLKEAYITRRSYD